MGRYTQDCLVVNLQDSKVSETLQLDPDLTLDKAVTTARQQEAVKQQEVVRGSKEGEGLTLVDSFAQQSSSRVRREARRDMPLADSGGAGKGDVVGVVELHAVHVSNALLVMQPASRVPKRVSLRVFVGLQPNLERCWQLAHLREILLCGNDQQDMV